MTLQEVCWELNLSESTITQKFERTKKNLLKNKGLILEKHGRGANADYTISKNELKNSSEKSTEN